MIYIWGHAWRTLVHNHSQGERLTQFETESVGSELLEVNWKQLNRKTNLNCNKQEICCGPI